MIFSIEKRVENRNRQTVVMKIGLYIRKKKVLACIQAYLPASRELIIITVSHQTCIKRTLHLWLYNLKRKSSHILHSFSRAVHFIHLQSKKTFLKELRATDEQKCPV